MKASVASGPRRGRVTEKVAVRICGSSGVRAFKHRSGMKLWWAVWQVAQRAPEARSRVPEGSLAFTVECLRRTPFTPMRGYILPWPVTNASEARPLKPRYANEESFLADSQDTTHVAAALVLRAKEFVTFDARQAALAN